MFKKIVIPEPWLSFWHKLDEFVTEPIEFHCLGGFVITLLYGFERSTADIDVISITPRNAVSKLVDYAGKGSPLHKEYGIYLDVVGIATIPENYDKRLCQISKTTFKNIKLFALDPYDIALAKIERNIQRDRDDVKYLAKVVPFDLDILKERYQKELRVYLGNPKREDLTLKLWIESIEEERIS
jgi:Nucleotidyltransferase of unknown function (DUF6036)